VQVVVRKSLVELMEMVLDTPKSARNGLSIVLQLLSISIFEYAWVVDQALLEAVLERAGLMMVRAGSAETVRDVAGFLARVLEAMWRRAGDAADPMDTGSSVDVGDPFEDALRGHAVLLLEACEVASGSSPGGRQGPEHQQQQQQQQQQYVLRREDGTTLAMGARGCEQVIAGVIGVCAGVLRRVGTGSVGVLVREGIGSSPDAISSTSTSSASSVGPTVLHLVLELLLSPSRMVQRACLEFLDGVLRDPLVADDVQLRWAVVGQCRHVLGQLIMRYREDDGVVHGRIADLLWTVWCVGEGGPDDADDQELREEVLGVVEQVLLRVGCGEGVGVGGVVGLDMEGMATVRDKFGTLFCDCVIEAPDVGVQVRSPLLFSRFFSGALYLAFHLAYAFVTRVSHSFACSRDTGTTEQFPAVFRNWSSWNNDANPALHRRLLLAASVVLDQYPSDDVSGFLRTLRPSACAYVQDGDAAPTSSARKRRKVGLAGNANANANVDSPALGARSNRVDQLTTSVSPQNNPSSQISSPSLSRLVKDVLVAIYRDMDAMQKKFAECSMDGTNEGLVKQMYLLFDRVLLSLAFVAGLNRDVAAELIEDVAQRVGSATLVQDLRHILTVQLATLTHDICESHSLKFAEKVLERRRTALQTSDAASFYDLFLGDTEVLPNDAMQVPARSLEIAHFLPLMVLTQPPKRAPPASKAKGKRGAAEPLASLPHDFLLRAASVSPAAAKAVVLGIIVYLAGAPDAAAMFDLARDAVFLRHAACEGLDAEGSGGLQPRDAKEVAEVLFALSEKYPFGGDGNKGKDRDKDKARARERAAEHDRMQALIVQAAIMGFHRASLTDSPAWRGLAKYVIHAMQSKGRAAKVLLSRLSVLKCESFVLALTVPAARQHPISSKDRLSASIIGENDVVKALQLELPKAISEASVFQNILVALEYCSTSMRNVNAVNLSLVILICHLESKDIVIAALAAQALLGIAAAKGQPLKDMLLQNDSLLEILGPRLPRKTDLLIELADLVDLKDRALLSACMSTILPSIWAKGGVDGVAGLAKQLGTSPQQLLLRYGEHPLTASFMNKKPTTEEFLHVARAIMKDDFDGFVTSITPRTLSELILEMGANQAWNSHQGSLPEGLVDLTSKSIAVLIGKLQTDTSSVRPGDVPALLAEGDNVTRLLKHLGDKFDDHSAKDSKLKIIRGVIFLIRVTGKFVGRHLPQFLVLLSASIRRTAPVEVRVQGLIGMTYLIRALASYAPLQLGSSSNQVAVALLDSLQTEGPVGDAAFKALEVLVEQCRRLFPEKLRNLPPIPQCSSNLRALSAGLTDDQNTAAENVRSLLQGLQEESLDVRAVTLGELRNILRSQRQWVSTLINPNRSSEDDSLLRDLISALVKSCSPEITSLSSITAQQVCAECLGILGALDPSRVRLNSTYEPVRYQSPLELAHDVLINHLIKVLMTANSMSVLDRVTVAIQDVLKCDDIVLQGKQSGKRKSRDKSNAMFDTLPQDARAVVKPYLESRYSFGPLQIPKHGFIYNRRMRFRVWLGRWLVKMIHQCGKNPMVAFYLALVPVVLFDVPTAMKIAPYVILAYLEEAGTAASKEIVGEILHVIDQNATPTSDGLSCMQAIFSLLDVLNLWSEDQQYPADFDWGVLEKMTKKDIPRIKLAHAASTCGAHARALLYYETHLRMTKGNGANPAAAEQPELVDEEVNLLMDIYSKLEEPDGLDGIMKLRRGTTKLEDQRLAAERNGSWTEACSLYELDISRCGGSASGGRSGAHAQGHGRAAAAATAAASPGAPACNPSMSRNELTDGYLNCLLHMGHWEGLANQVRGLLLSEDVDDLQYYRMASKGAGALWRLGKFDDEMVEYVKIPDAVLKRVTLDEAWELKLARVLSNLNRMGRIARGDLSLAANAGPSVPSAPTVASIATASVTDLSALRDAITKELSTMRHDIVPHFSAAAKESYGRAYPFLVKLHMIQEIADAVDAVEHGADRSQGNIGAKERRRMLRWKERFSVTRPTMNTRGPILELRRQLAALMGDQSEVGVGWLEHAKLCRETGNLDTAMTSAAEARTLGVPGANLEHLEIMNVRGNTHRALQEAKGMLPLIKAGGSKWPEKYASSKEHEHFLSQIMLKEAQWTAEMGQGTREEVDALFYQALSVRNGKWEAGLFHYALYLDQYMQDAKARQDAMDKHKRAKHVSDRLGGKSRVQLAQDRPFFSHYPDVIEVYGRCLEAGTDHIYRALPRLLTLWFEVGSLSLDEGVDGRLVDMLDGALDKAMTWMKQYSKSLPPSIWMTAMPQLISRICHDNRDVAELIRLIITDAAAVYPHQVMWALMGVSKSTRPNRKSAARSIINGAKRRASAADKDVFVDSEGFAEQINKLCFYVPQDNAKTISAKRHAPHLVKKMPFHNRVAVPTLRILSDFQKDELVTVAGVEDDIAVMSSLQKPKRIVFIGSDGKSYPFLAKPKDDLRKDNRMMEVAGVLNALFSEDPDARERDLYLRRFAVVPISEDSGLVEWVVDTKPVRSLISEVIVDDPRRLKAMNMEIKKAYDQSVADQKKDSNAVKQWLTAVLEKYPPVFNKWWTKHYPDPATWLSARLNFTRTYAVWCMVGHAVGLGDRHLENVLLDTSNGDAIQIDFGCLFDKGLTLPQPEVVPFRLTQNIIDAFGYSGVDGVYRQSFEMTLSILRKNKGSMLSVMEGFVHDPLVDWSRNESRRASSGDKEASNAQARDWLATIEGRLDGTLLGVYCEATMPLSVQGQAQRLIAEASDLKRLSLMYIWWQSWY